MESPFWMSPLFDCSGRNSSNRRHEETVESRGSYRTIQRIVTSTTTHFGGAEGGDMETVLEEYIPNAASSPLFRRVAVRGVSSSSSSSSCRGGDSLYASFSLPHSLTTASPRPQRDGASLSSSPQYYDNDKLLLCWTTFGEQDDRVLLCVLVQPTQLAIFDPFGSGGGEDGGCRTTIPLPFEASGVLALHPGVLIQRKMPPPLAAAVATWAGAPTVLLQPPPTGKFHSPEQQEEGEETEPTPWGTGGAGDGQQPPPLPQQAVTSSDVVMEDGVGPHKNHKDTDDDDDDDEDFGLALSSSPPPLPPFWTGPGTTLNDEPFLFSLLDPLSEVRPLANTTVPAQERLLFVARPRSFSSCSASLPWVVVTFHSDLQRHAIWTLKRLPPPPAPPPLWAQTSMLQRAHAQSSPPTAAPPPAQTQEQQLEEDSRRFFPNRQDDDDDDDEPLAGETTEAAATATVTTTANINTTATTMGAYLKWSLDYEALYPDFSISCIHEEEEGAYRTGAASAAAGAARRVLLATNGTGTGDEVLALLLPRHPKNRHNAAEPPNVLRCFTLETTDSGNITGVLPLMELPCQDAQPIASTPIPLSADMQQRLPRDSLSLSNKTVMARDLLIQPAFNTATLALYRASCHLMDCALPPPKEETKTPPTLVHISNPVEDRVDIGILADHLTIRAQVSLMIPSCAVTERALQAMEAALHDLMDQDGQKEAFAEFTLRLRCAVICKLQSSGDTAWNCLESVICRLLQEAGADEEVDAVMETADAGNGQDDEGEAWESLLQSEYHGEYLTQYGDLYTLLDETPSCKVKPTKDDAPSLFLAEKLNMGTLHLFKQSIFDALHLLYQDLKLTMHSRGSEGLTRVGRLLMHICWSRGETTGPVPLEHFMDHFMRDMSDLATMVESCPRGRDAGSVSRFSDVPCVWTWIEQQIQTHPDETPPSFPLNGACSSTLLLDCLWKLHRRASSGEAAARERLVELVSEQDAFEIFHLLPISCASFFVEAARPWQTTTTSAGTQGPRQDKGPTSADSGVLLSVSADPDKDGILPTEKLSTSIFPDDNRVHEAGRLLRTSRPTFLRLERSVEVSDHDFERLKQERLLVLCQRALALPLGRGMLTLSNLLPVPAEPLQMPPLCLSGRVPVTNAIVALDVSNCPADMRIWPEFHNGVAAGLRLPLASVMEHAATAAPPTSARQRVSQITRTWILYNNPRRNRAAQAGNSGPNNNNPAAAQGNQNTSPPNHAHGGLLLALGLRGHLSTLAITDLYDYLTEGAVTSKVGVLLGMAANRRGSCDPTISKMLCLHLPSLMPSSLASVDVESTTQAAAIAGIGLLYQGSSHRLMSEFLLNEIGKRPTNDQNTVDRESYTLSCGLAMGMVNLSCGTAPGRDGTATTTGPAGLSDLRVEDRLYRYIVGGIDVNSPRQRRDNLDRASGANGTSGGENERCSLIYEGDAINTDVTAPGATLALGLMYLQSGNRTVASRLSVPDTPFLLDFVRPDFLMLRVVAKALVLWDEVQPSPSWIDEQIPAVVRQNYERMSETAKRKSGFGVFQNLNDETSAGDAAAKSRRQVRFDTARGGSFDRQAVRQNYTCIVAGAALGVGLRFAGTGDKDAASAITARLMHMYRLREENDPVSQALRPERPILEMCLVTTAMALGMVMAGTGDMASLRIFRALRSRCDESVRHGTHMAIGASIGLLFLGGGTYTLSREPEDVAALLMAFFPRFPFSTSDNKYHLQALRHFYVLATKKRMHPVGEAQSTAETVPRSLSSPPPSSSLVTISNAVLSVVLNRTFDELYKVGGSRNFQATNIADATERQVSEISRLIRFAGCFCGVNATTEAQASTSMSPAFREILRCCLVKYRPDSVFAAVWLYHVVSRLGCSGGPWDNHAVWEVRILGAIKAGMFTKSMVADLCEMISAFLDPRGGETLLSYLECSCDVSHLSKLYGSDQALGAFLAWHNVPPPVVNQDEAREILSHVHGESG